MVTGSPLSPSLMPENVRRRFPTATSQSSLLDREELQQCGFSAARTPNVSLPVRTPGPHLTSGPLRIRPRSRRAIGCSFSFFHGTESRHCVIFQVLRIGVRLHSLTVTVPPR